jgi:hypothetical protein
MHPLDGKGLTRDFTGYYRKIPAAWIIAHKVMLTMTPKLSLRLTDCSHILTSEVSILHALNIAKAHGDSVFDGRALTSMLSNGIRLLKDVESWTSTYNTIPKFRSYTDPPGNSKWTVRSRENWYKLAHILNSIKAEWFTIGNTDLMTRRDIRQSSAESYISTMAIAQPLPPSISRHAGSTWASDGSMVPAASRIGDAKSVTAALMGPSTLVL